VRYCHGRSRCCDSEGVYCFVGHESVGHGRGAWEYREFGGGSRIDSRVRENDTDGVNDERTKFNDGIIECLDDEHSIGEDRGRGRALLKPVGWGLCLS